jgi:hypothetical protein
MFPTQVSSRCVACSKGLFQYFPVLIKEATQLSVLIDLGLRFEPHPQLETEVPMITLAI